MSTSSTTTPTLQSLHTACLDCAFARFDDSGPVPSQDGCYAGRLEKYLAEGSAVAAENEAAQFYIVNGRRCNMKRQIMGPGENDPIQEAVAQARSEEKIRLAGIVLLLDGDMEDWRNRLYVSVMSLVGPLNAAVGLTNYDEIIVVQNQDQVSLQEVTAHLAEVLGPYSISYQLVRVVGRDESGGQVDKFRALDEGTRAIRSSHFFTIVPLGHYVPAALPAVVDIAVNDDLARFVALTPEDDWSGLTVSVKVYRNPVVGGFEEMEFADPDGNKRAVSSLAEKLRLLTPDLIEPLHNYVSECGCGPQEVAR